MRAPEIQYNVQTNKRKMKTISLIYLRQKYRVLLCELYCAVIPKKDTKSAAVTKSYYLSHAVHFLHCVC